jgi:hypothetical protein
VNSSRRVQIVAFVAFCLLFVVILLADWQAHAGGGIDTWQPTVLGWALLLAGLVVAATVLVLSSRGRSRRLFLNASLVLLVLGGALHGWLMLTADREVSSTSYGASPDGRSSLVVARYAGGQDYAAVYVLRDDWHLVRHAHVVEWPQDGYVPSNAHWIDDRTLSIDGDRVDIAARSPFVPAGP